MLVLQSGIWRICADSAGEGYWFEADSEPPFGWIHADDFVRKRPARHLVRKVHKLRKAIANSEYRNMLKFAEYQNEHLGYDFVCTAYPQGHRCGYVNIPRTHPWYGMKNYDEVMNVDVHGGITFNRLDVKTRIRDYVNSRWIGFDCNHYNDAPDPEVQAKHGYKDPIQPMNPHGVVRSLEYVIAECRRVCEQVAERA